MSQTIEGSKKTRATMIKKHGSEEAWKEHMRRIGSAGGKKKNPDKGFGSMDKEKVKAAGKLGGSRSKRTKSIDYDLSYEDINTKAETKKRVYTTRDLGMDSNSVPNTGGVLRRAVDRVLK